LLHLAKQLYYDEVPMSNTNLITITCLVSVVVHASAKDEKTSSPLVELTVDCKNRQLYFRLTNKSPKEIKCTDIKLPWRHLTSMTLLVVESETAVPLEDSWEGKIDDPFLKPIILRPKAALTGRIDLQDRFRDIARVLARSGVDIFWSYEMKDVDGRRSNRIGGWLYLPKSK
jgi:hypothetical protein